MVAKVKVARASPDKHSFLPLLRCTQGGQPQFGFGVQYRGHPAPTTKTKIKLVLL